MFVTSTLRVKRACLTSIRAGIPSTADTEFGKCFRITHKKNAELHFVPVVPELQEYLASMKVRTKDGPIALRHNGQPWESAEQLQKQSSNFLKGLEKKDWSVPVSPNTACVRRSLRPGSANSGPAPAR
jgi:hypothetical protein